jgi:hypothetical protein
VSGETISGPYTTGKALGFPPFAYAHARRGRQRIAWYS